MGLCNRFDDFMIWVLSPVDRGAETPEMKALIKRMLNEARRGTPSGIAESDMIWDIYAGTPWRRIPAGFKMGSVPAGTSEEALRYWAGESRFAFLDESRIILRDTDIVWAVPKDAPPPV